MARRRQREEGAVMLIVMLILMVSTATAAVSVHATRYELQAAGHARQAMQTKYVSESVAMNTVAWFDKMFDPNTGGGFGQFYQSCVNSAGAGQEMYRFGQPNVSAATTTACRLSRGSMDVIDPRAANERFATRAASDPEADAPEAGEPPLDVLGTTGPRQAYRPEENFISDVMCRMTNMDKPGGSKARQYRCTVTARGRMCNGTGDSPCQSPAVGTRNWTIGTGPTPPTYQQNPFSTYHESRMVLLTEEELVPGG